MHSSFAELLVRHRAAARVTQEGLAERAQLSAAAISALERGTRKFPHRATVQAIADALGLDAAGRDELVALSRRPSVPRNQTHQPRSRPSQLPAAIADFTGRFDQVRLLTEVLTSPPPSGPVVAVVTGMAGVGKTALAVQVGHALADQFPDGQLYLNLRGFGPHQPVPAIDALGFLLRSLGTPAEEVPLDLDEAAARYRTALGTRRLLLVLDNARDTAQLRPLLPGSQRSAVLITSRHVLSTLPGARSLRLETFVESEGLGLLGQLAGSARVEAEVTAAREVVRLCGSLPLAIRIAGARLATRTAWPIAQLAERLGDQRGRLDLLERDEIGVRASFAVSIDQLAESDDPIDQAAARAFGMLAATFGPEVSLAVAGSLLDLPARQAERILDRLVDLHLLETIGPDRYRFHDLLRDYASQRAIDTISATDRAAARTRVLELYLAAAWRGGWLARPGSSRHGLAEPGWMARSPRFETAPDAWHWLEAHRTDLVAATDEAITDPRLAPELGIRLAVGLVWFYTIRRHWSDWLQVTRSALAALESESDPTIEALLRNDLGLALAALAESGVGTCDEAIAQLDRAYRDFRRLGDRQRESVCLVNLTLVLEQAGRPDEAIKLGERCLEIKREVGDVNGQALICGNLGRAYGSIGDRAKQLAYLEEGFVLVQRAGDVHALAEGYLLRAAAYRAAGQVERAFDDLYHSVEVYHQAGDPIGAADALVEIGTLQLELGNPREALDHLLDALDLAERHDDRRHEAAILVQVGRVMLGDGEFEDAEAHLQRALELSESMGLPAEEVRGLLAELRAGAGR